MIIAMKLLSLLLIPILTITNEPQDSLKADKQLNNYNLKSHESLVRFKHKNKVPGLAFTVFNGQEEIFSECLGSSTYGFKIDDELPGQFIRFWIFSARCQL